MKKINIIAILMCALCFTACDQEDNINTTFDVQNGQSLVAFDGSSSNLAVLINETGSVDVVVNVTTVSDADRTVSISVDESSTANSENYSLPSTVTIPAGSFQGVLPIDGVDISVEPEAETIVLNIDGFSGDNVTLSGQQHTVNLFQVCPIPETYFVGDYMVSDVDAVVGPGNGTENFAAGVVTVSVNEDDATQRDFTAGILPAFAGNRDVTVGLVCFKLNLQEVDPNLTCNGTDSYIFVGAGADNSSYDLADDTSFLVTYTEDPEGSCGGPFLSSFMLTKL